MAHPEADRHVLVGCLAARVGLLTPGDLATDGHAGLTPEDVAALDHLVRRLEAGGVGLRLTPAERRLVTPPPADTHSFHPDDRAATTALPHERGDSTDEPDRTRLHEPGGAADWAEPADPHGRRYERTRLHAAGGMGRVWVARDPALDRAVALKELRPDRGGRPVAVARFVEEARVTGQLEHPNIVPVYEFSPASPGRPPFYTMRLVAGRTLAEAGKEYHAGRARGEAGAVEFRQLLAAFLGVCNAVAYAHDKGVIHRDLKGANVVLGAYGEVVVLDWGLAKRRGAAESAADPDRPGDGQIETAAGTVLGTPSYMAPEQAEGRPDLIDERSDVYGLGAILYELLAGGPPFTGTDTADVLRKVRHEPPPPPRSADPDAPRALEAVCLKALAKRPEDRYAAVAELSADVQRFLADEPVSVYRGSLLDRAGRWVRKNRALAAALAVAAAVLVPALAVLGEVERRNAKAMAGEQKQTADARALADSRLEQVVDTWYTQLITVQNELDQQAVSPQFRLRVLSAAKDRLADVLRDQPRTRATDHMRHVLHRRIAHALRGIGDLAGAEPELEVARQIAADRFREDPDGPDSRRDVADACFDLSEHRAANAQWDAALVALADGEVHLAAHLAAHPGDSRAADDRASLAEQRARVLLLAKRDATAAAAEAVRAARENAAKRPDHPHAQSLLQQALQTATAEAHTRRASAAVLLTEALAHADAQLERDGGTPRFAADRARLLALRGEDAVLKGDVADARDWFHKSLAIRLELARPASAPPHTVLDLVVVYERLGDLSMNATRYPDAVIEYGQATRHLDRVLVANPTRATRAMRGNLLARLGSLETAQEHAAEARAHLTKCEAIRRALADESPSDLAAKQDLAQAHRLLADLEKSPPVLRFDAAERHYKEAVQLVGGVKPGDQFAADSDWGARYCRSVLDVIANPAAAKTLDPAQAFPQLIARMRVLAQRGDAAGAAATGDMIREIRPTDGAFVAGAARGYALAVKVETDPAAKDRYARTASALLAEAAERKANMKVYATGPDFEAYRAYTTRPIPTAAP